MDMLYEDHRNNKIRVATTMTPPPPPPTTTTTTITTYNNLNWVAMPIITATVFATNHITTKLTNPNQDQRHKYHHLTTNLHFETSVTNNSFSEDYSHPYNHTRHTNNNSCKVELSVSSPNPSTTTPCCIHCI